MPPPRENEGSDAPDRVASTDIVSHVRRHLNIYATRLAQSTVYLCLHYLACYRPPTRTPVIRCAHPLTLHGLFPARPRH